MTRWAVLGPTPVMPLSGGAENAESDLGADAVNAEELGEELFGGQFAEGVEVVGVFTDLFMNVEFVLSAHWGAAPIIDGNVQLVAYSPHLDNERVGEFFGNGASKGGDHRAYCSSRLTVY
jgi:hypothetical protein